MVMPSGTERIKISVTNAYHLMISVSNCVVSGIANPIKAA
jgi:hypothetical protein